MKQLYVAWTTDTRRPVTMQRWFNFELGIMATRNANSPMNKIFMWFRTWFLLIVARPSTVWIQAEHRLLLVIALLYRSLFHNPMMIVADCPNRMFHRTRRLASGGFRLLDKADVILVPYHRTKLYAMQRGIAESKLAVLEPGPDESLAMVAAESSSEQLAPRAWWPCSSKKAFRDGLALARLVPEIHYVFAARSGLASKMRKYKDMPVNVTIVDANDGDDRRRSISQCTIAVGIAWDDDKDAPDYLMDAISGCLPIVLANSKVVKELFPRGAVYVNPEHLPSIAHGCMDAVQHLELLRTEVGYLREELVARERRQAMGLVGHIAPTSAAATFVAATASGQDWE